MARLRLMTHNVWNNDENLPAWAEKGFDCSAEARVPVLLRIYKELLPDVIGCQEVSAHIKELMKAGLPDYTCIGDGYTPIFYRADKLTLIEEDFFRYPEAMEGWDGLFNDMGSKSYSIGVFEVKENGARFIFASTHLWWKRSPKADMKPPYPYNYQEGSNEARAYQLALLMKRLEALGEKYRCPRLIVGDLNDGYTTLAVQSVLKNGYLHAHDIATEYAEEAVGYHYCFADGFKEEYYDEPFEWAIDHILVCDAKKDAVLRFERYSPNYYFPISDHSPAYIDITL